MHLAYFQACEIRSCGKSPLITLASEIAASMQQQQKQQQYVAACTLACDCLTRPPALYSKAELADPDPTLDVASITQICFAIRNLTSRPYLHPDQLGEPDTPCAFEFGRRHHPLCRSSVPLQHAWYTKFHRKVSLVIPATCILACFLQLDTIHTLENQTRIVCPKFFLQKHQSYTHIRT